MSKPFIADVSATEFILLVAIRPVNDKTACPEQKTA
jgi:hypothetical protein